jgi:hypothetical protein
MVCDPNRGECTGCVTDADCPPALPFCDALGACVECLNDVQCEAQGVACVSGECGRCGDGICDPREAFYWATEVSSSVPRFQCKEDCIGLCDPKDIGSALGHFSIEHTRLKNVFSDSCGRDIDGVEGIFAWKAPRRGLYRFVAIGAEISLAPSCDSFDPYSATCAIARPNDAGPLTVHMDLSVNLGDELVIVVETGKSQADSVALEITCVPPGCEPSGPLPGVATCLANADRRGEPHCDGLQCACQYCFDDYDRCAVVPGCPDIGACMRDKACVGKACYDSGDCKTLVDSFGGLQAPAFDTAARLQSCASTFACALPCADAGAADAAKNGADAGDDKDGGHSDAGTRVQSSTETTTCGCRLIWENRRSTNGTGRWLFGAAALLLFRSRRSAISRSRPADSLRRELHDRTAPRVAPVDAGRIDGYRE